MKIEARGEILNLFDRANLTFVSSRYDQRKLWSGDQLATRPDHYAPPSGEFLGLVS